MLGQEPALCLFSGKGSQSLAEQVAREMGRELDPCLVTTWANGEIRAQLQTSVRGADVFIFQSFAEQINDRLIELLILVDAAIRASAGQVTVVAPYLPYSLQEKKVRGREPISAKLVANLIVQSGANRVVAVELHEPAIQAFYDIPFDHLSALGVMANYLRDNGYRGKRSVVVAPDEGALEMAVEFAEMLEAGVAVVFKRHPEEAPEAVETTGFVGNVQGKRVVILDDIILGGSTLINAAEMMLQKGASEVTACVVHAILCGDAIKRVERSELKALVITDSTNPSAAERSPKIRIASIAPLLAQVIQRIHRNQSVSEIMPKEQSHARAHATLGEADS